MKKSTKDLLSFVCIALFALFAIASKVNKIHYGAFKYNNNVEDNNEKGTFLVKNDGTKIYGTKIQWKSGLLVKDQIKIDEQKFKPSEIRGFKNDNVYYGRINNQYAKRIVHGKINVYVIFTEVSSTSTSSTGRITTRNYTRTDQYAQKGENGQMIGVANQDDIKNLVADCPAALAMANLSNRQIRKAIRKNPNYLNSIFDVYNNNCTPVN